MESVEGSDVEMTIRQQTPQTVHCKSGPPEVCSHKKQNSNWSPKAWIWRISNAAMVVFFVTAAYVQVHSIYRIIHICHSSEIVIFVTFI